MRIFLVTPDQFTELAELPIALPAAGFVWIGSARREFEVRTTEIQSALQRWTGSQLVDLHVSDLLNNQLPSHFDYTSSYDQLVFRRLAAGAATTACSPAPSAAPRATRSWCSTRSTPDRSASPFSTACC